MPAYTLMTVIVLLRRGISNFHGVGLYASKPEDIITVHRYSPTAETSLIDPNQPLRAEADNS